jgi:hypothetical protein
MIESEWYEISRGQYWQSANRPQGFTAAHLAAITATSWILLLNAVVGFQILDDGTPVSVALIFGSAAALFIGTGYIALDTGFSWTGHFDPSLVAPNRNIGLYVLYLLVPLIFIVVFFILETLLVIRVLGETKPLGNHQKTRAFLRC